MLSLISSARLLSCTSQTKLPLVKGGLGKMTVPMHKMTMIFLSKIDWSAVSAGVEDSVTNENKCNII